MSSSIFFLLGFLFVLLCHETTGHPISEEKHSSDAEVRDVSRIFPLDGKDWSYFNGKWSLPSFPSISSLFKDDEDDIPALRKRIEALEKSQNEILALLKKLVAASQKPVHNNKQEAGQSTGINRPQEESGSANDKAKPVQGSSDITNDKNESAMSNGKKDDKQNVPVTMDTDVTGTSAPTKNNDKGDAMQAGTEKQKQPMKKDEKVHKVSEEEPDQKLTSASKKGEQENAMLPVNVAEGSENTETSKETEKPEILHSTNENSNIHTSESNMNSNSMPAEVHEDNNKQTTETKLENPSLKNDDENKQQDGKTAAVLAFVEPDNPENLAKQ